MYPEVTQIANNAYTQLWFLWLLLLLLGLAIRYLVKKEKMHIERYDTLYKEHREERKEDRSEFLGAIWRLNDAFVGFKETNQEILIHLRKQV